jgi:lipid II:glycine glycyltransferase (peptidoglycan interpeptide bridge formation enzyme)
MRFMGPSLRHAASPLVTAPYTVVEEGTVSPSHWDGWLESSPGGGHILQSYEWGEFKRELNWEPVRLVLEREGQVVGLGQFLAYDTPLVPGTLMYCAKGPWLPWEDKEAVRAFFRGVLEVAECHGAHTVKIEPEVGEQQTQVKALLSEMGFRRFRWDLNFKTTMIVDLHPSEEKLLANMKGKTRYNVRLAARKGVRIVEDNSPEAREHFWGMFEQTAERNGFVIRRSRDYQLAVLQAMDDAGRAHLFFATHERDRLAAMLIYTFGNKCWYMLGASTNEKRNLMSNYLLQWEVMRWAKRRGIRYYDMVGVPSPDNLDESNSLYGVYRFKAGFGGEIADFMGCLDLPVKPVRAKLWNRIEPAYYRLHQKLKNNIYY